MVTLLAAATGGCASPFEFLGKVAGGEVGRRVAAAPPTRVVVSPKGGSFCKVLGAMGGPFPIVPTDARATQDIIVIIDEHGARHCKWKEFKP